MLTTKKIEALNPTTRGYKKGDGGGLYLYVTPNGLKVWRLRWRNEAGEQTTTLGHFPQMSLKVARDERDRRRLAPKAPPVQTRPTLREVAEMWLAANRVKWKPNHADNLWRGLEQWVLAYKLPDGPQLGDRPIDKIDSYQLALALRATEARGAVDTARRMRARLVHVWSYASSLIPAFSANPARDLSKSMAAMPPAGERPAVLTIEEARQVLRTCEASADVTVQLAMRLLALTGLRQGECIKAQWTELLGLHGETEPLWIVPAHRMKSQRDNGGAHDHHVPLSRQAVEIFHAIHPLTGHSPFVFPLRHNWQRPMSGTTLAAFLDRTGWQGRHCPHGWRSTFSTIMNRRSPNHADAAAIELMLAHKPPGAMRLIYQREWYLELLPRRREIAQEWADLLLEGMPSAAEIAARGRHPLPLSLSPPHLPIRG